MAEPNITTACPAPSPCSTAQSCQCPAPQACPEVKTQTVYVQGHFRWCEAEVCTAGEVAGGLFYVTVALVILLAITLGLRYFWNEVGKIVREYTADHRNRLVNVIKAENEQVQSNKAAMLKLRKQELDMEHEAKVREGARVISQKKAELDAATGWSPKP